jgi:hypothetical protein
MGYSRVRAKVRRRKVAALAAYSRQFTVKNIKKGISEVVNHKRYGTEVPKDMIIKSPYSGIEYVMTNPHPIHGEKYGVTVTGYDWVPIDEYKASTGLLWEHKKHPQPKRLLKCKKKMKQKGNAVIPARNDFLAYFPNFPYTLPKMNKVQYMKKLVEHKLAKWERKNVCPAEMFTEDVEKWKHEREIMKERFGDLVASIYDKLKVTATLQIPGGPPYKDVIIGTVKDTGDSSKIIEMANNIVKRAKTKHKNILHAQLLNHKMDGYRLLAA